VIHYIEKRRKEKREKRGLIRVFGVVIQIKREREKSKGRRKVFNRERYKSVCKQ